MATISQKASDKGFNNNRVIGRLMAYYDRHYETIRRWLKDRNEDLATPVPLTILREELGLTDQELLEEEREPAKA